MKQYRKPILVVLAVLATSSGIFFANKTGHDEVNEITGDTLITIDPIEAPVCPTCECPVARARIVYKYVDRIVHVPVERINFDTPFCDVDFDKGKVIAGGGVGQHIRCVVDWQNRKKYLSVRKYQKAQQEALRQVLR